MARARLLKPGFFANEELAALSLRARLLFAGLWTLADRRGRLEDRPMRIKGALFPYENVSTEKHLAELAAGGFILRYEVEGERFIQIPSWKNHQKPHQNEPESKIPLPPNFSDAPSPNGSSPSTIGASAPAEAEAETKAEALTGMIDPEAEAEAEADNALRDKVLRHLHDCGISEKGLAKKVEEGLDEFGLECIQHCLEEAVVHNKLSWAYVHTIMTRHQRDGCPPPELVHMRRRDRMIAGART